MSTKFDPASAHVRAGRWRNRRRAWPLALLLIAAILGGLQLSRPTAVAAFLPGSNPVIAAWQAAQQRGAYHFESDLTQTTTPLATLTNVGKTSREQRFRLEGDNNLTAQTMNLRLWANDGNLAQTRSGVEVRVADGKTQTRKWDATGEGEWQAAQDFTNAVAPAGDFMAWLAGLRNLQTLGTETKAGFTYTRYSFDLDGPTIATHLRDQMQAALQQKGELPSGIQLQEPEQYAQMTGTGQLWVRADGLPLRQIIDVQFPAERDEVTTARIDTTFGDFADVKSVSATVGQSVSGANLGWLGFLSLLGFTSVMIITHRRSRMLYTALVSALIFSQVAGPLLQNAHIVRFLDTSAARAQTSETQQTEQEMLDAVRSLDVAPRLDPNTDPLATSEQPAFSDQSPNLPISQSPISNLQTAGPAPTDATDTDSDGLTDYNELRVGTLTGDRDTDSDGVSDRDEVIGFALGGRTWYGDPLLPDSNRDGLGDVQEWNRDTDGDGLPDLHDVDNDNDGVNDSDDLTPFSRLHPNNNAAQAYSEAQPLGLTLSGVVPSLPTFVDVQVRPRNPEHLWYALNVLDWPTDRAGQVQDGDNVTLAALAENSGRLPAGNENNGDMRLIPLLEFRFANNNAHLPSSEDLYPYGITRNNLTADGSEQVAYVPLNLVTNAESGERQAFQARMFYRPTTSTFGAPHQVRLVWVVQMLVDECIESNDGSCTRYGQRNQLQVVQSYYDEFYVTGLNVRQDAGTMLATIYQDPAASDPARPANYPHDGAVWSIIHGLDTTFLVGRDADNNGQPDLTVPEIERRFNHPTNSTVGSDERWGIPDLLRVERRTYDTYDRALATTAITETNRILNNVFTPARQQDPSLRPRLLFVREERVLTQSLDSSGAATVAGNNVTFSLAPGGQASPLTTIAGINVSTYCPGSNGSGWVVCEAADEWREIETRFRPNLPASAEGNAQLTLLRFYMLALRRGITVVTQIGATIPQAPQGFQSDASLAGDIRGGGDFVRGVVVFLLNIKLIDGEASLPDSVVRSLTSAYADGTSAQAVGMLGISGIAKEFLRDLWRNSKTSVIIGIVVAVLVVAAIITGVVLTALHAPTQARVALNFTLLALPILVQLYTATSSLVAVGQLVGAGLSLGTVLSSHSTIISSSQRASIIGLAIGLIIIWGVFVANIVLSRTSAFSPQFNLILAQAVAQSILLIAMFALSLSVIGTIIVAVIALIDAILTIICEAGVDDLRRVPGLNGACFTLNTAATAVATRLLYSFDLLVDTDRSELVVSQSPRYQLSDPSRGYVAGNTLNLSMRVTNTVVGRDPDVLNTFHVNPLYLFFWRQEYLRTTNLQQSLSQGAQALHVGRNPLNGDNQWGNSVVEDHRWGAVPIFRAQRAETITLNDLPLQAGLNQDLGNPAFNFGYALPAYECWTIPNIVTFVPPVFPICYDRTVAGSNSNRLPLRLDVFPATIDEFMALTALPNGGHRLAWSSAFPSLYDADGDGLIARGRNGIDPNDASPNQDGDGLTDLVELEWRQRGFALNLNSWDTDSDGLSDDQELRIGSNPAQVDSDNDGLRDGDEVYHQVYAFANGRATPTNNWAGGWTITITGTQQLSLRVSSDPALPDSDGDGIYDQAEFQLSQASNPAFRLDPDGVVYHPQIFNTNPLGINVAIDDIDRILSPGQSFAYSTTVTGRNVPLAAGGLTVSAPPQLSAPQTIHRLDFTTANAITTGVTAVTNFTLANNATNGVLAITSQANVRLQADPNVKAWQWLPPTPSTINYSALPSGWLSGFGDVASTRPDRGDSYALVSMVRQNSTQPLRYPGHIVYDAHAFAAANTASPRLDQNNTVPGFINENLAQVACNDNNRCLTVWAKAYNRAYSPSAATQSIVGRVTNRDFTTLVTAETPIAGGGASGTGNPIMDFNPVVASDGANFLVVWERLRAGAPNVRTTSGIYHRFISAEGVALTADTLLPGTEVEVNPALSYRAYTAFDLVWTGSRYRMAIVRHNSNVFALDLLPNGTVPFSALLASNGLSTSKPSIAADPNSRSTMLVYGTGSGQTGRVLLDESGNGRTVLPQLVSQVSPQVAWHPASRGWLLLTFGSGNATRYDLYNADGSARSDINPAANYSWPGVHGNERALACPAAGSTPDLLFEFEELPETTIFADASGNGQNATCSGPDCPISGVPGRNATDGAVRFNGSNRLRFTNTTIGDDSFSLTFWMRSSDRSAGGKPIFSNGAFIVQMINGRINFNIPGNVNLTQTTTDVANNQWHLVTLTQRGNSIVLRVDGGAVAETLPVTNQPTLGAGADIGFNAINNTFFTGELAQLAWYDAELLNDTALELLNGAPPAYCVAGGRSTAVGNPVIHRLQLPLVRNETRGGLLTNSNTLTFTVDATRPTSRITSLGGQLLGNPNGGPTTYIVAGVAEDAYGISQVELRVDGGPWQVVNGSASWSHAVSLTPGEHTLSTRATDNSGNVESNSVPFVTNVDNAPPVATLNDNILLARLVDDHYEVIISAAVSDSFVAGGSPLGGVATVEMLLQDAGAELAGNGWQPSLLFGNNWVIDYVLPAASPTPARPDGPYTLTVRATDGVGNVSLREIPVQIDSGGPTPALSSQDSSRTVISTTLTVSGVISDVSGVASAESAFVPIQRLRVISEALVFLPLDEAEDAVRLHDIAAPANEVYCRGACLTGAPGRNNGAVQLSADGNLQLINRGEFDFAADQSVSFQLWLRTSATAGNILSKVANNVGFDLSLQGGQAIFRLNGATIATSPAINNDQWHHLAGVVDRANNTATLYVDGQAAGSAPFTGALFAATDPNGAVTVGGRGTDININGGLPGLYDEVAIFQAALSAELVGYLYSSANTPWQPVTLTTPNAPVSNWSLAVPANLEGHYQLDLRSTDTRSYRDLNGNLWRGIIDTTAPRVAFDGTATGNTINDPQTGAPRFEIRYAYTATDRHISEAHFSGPCTGAANPVQRGFAADAEVAGLFPDLTVVNRLSTSCTVWEASATPSGMVQACDVYGHCTNATPTVSQSVSGAVNSASVDGAPKAQITNLSEGSLIASKGTLTLTVVANGDQSLKELVILLDNAPVQTINFAQTEAVKAVQRSLPINVSEGRHTLAVAVTDWANGAYTSTPINVLVDSTAPAIEISGETVNDSMVLAGNLSMLRFKGNVTDANGLAKVEIQVNNGVWQDVTFDEAGNWHTALYVPDDHSGDTLSCNVRATDKAGNVSQTSKPMTLAMSGLATMLATQLTEKSISGNTATFAFTGNNRQGNAVTSFLCRLDNANFSACTSPVTYRDLADGQHTFMVMATDAAGNVDITPAGYTWSIGSGQAPTTIKLYLPFIPHNAVQRGQSATEGNTPAAATVETVEATPVAAVVEAPVVEAPVENNANNGEPVNETSSAHLLYLPLVNQ